MTTRKQLTYKGHKFKNRADLESYLIRYENIAYPDARTISASIPIETVEIKTRAKRKKKGGKKP